MKESIQQRRGAVRAGWRWVVAAALIGMAALLQGESLGQNAIGDGTRLDNNLQQGTGGVNQGQVQPDYRLRNEMVTGNVSGLGYFHGNVGYRSTSDFQGGSSDDALFRFRAQSLSGGGNLPLGLGAPGGGGQGPVGVYRSFSSAGLGDLSPGVLGGTGRVQADGVVVKGYEPTLTAGGGALNVGRGLADTMGYTSDQAGRRLEITASPLLGIRQRVVEEQVGVDGLPARMLGADGKPIGEDGKAPLDGSDRYSRGAIGQSREREVKAKIQGLITPGSDVSVDVKLGQVQSMLKDDTLIANTKEGEDVYADVLARLKGDSGDEARSGTSRGGSKTDLDKAPKRPGDRDAEDEEAGLPGKGKGKDRSSKPGLDRPSVEKLAKARIEREKALREAAGGSTDSRIKKLLAERQGEGEPKQDDGEDSSTKSLDEMVASFKYKGPGLMTLAGSRQDRLNDTLRRAEAEMAEGRYFEAEGKYRLALTYSPGYPLARVGQVHAQMGAGMVVSAARNLRVLFQDQPEMIGVRYEQHLLPAAKRVEWIRNELEQMLSLSEKAQDPALLLAYLGYQFRTPDLVEYGLNVAQARSPLDPLVPILRRIWLEEQAKTPAKSEAVPGDPEPFK